MPEEGHISRGILVINAVLTFLLAKKEDWSGKKFQARQRCGLGMKPSGYQDRLLWIHLWTCKPWLFIVASPAEVNKDRLKLNSVPTGTPAPSLLRDPNQGHLKGLSECGAVRTKQLHFLYWSVPLTAQYSAFVYHKLGKMKAVKVCAI